MKNHHSKKMKSQSQRSRSPNEMTTKQLMRKRKELKKAILLQEIKTLETKLDLIKNPPPTSSSSSSTTSSSSSSSQSSESKKSVRMVQPAKTCPITVTDQPKICERDHSSSSDSVVVVSRGSSIGSGMVPRQRGFGRGRRVPTALPGAGKPAVPGNAPRMILTVGRRTGVRGKLFQDSQKLHPVREPVAEQEPAAVEPEPEAEPAEPEPVAEKPVTFGGVAFLSKATTKPLIDGDILNGLSEKVEKNLLHMSGLDQYTPMLRAVCSLQSDLTRWTTLVFKDIMSTLKAENRLEHKKWASDTVTDRLGEYKNFCSAEIKFLLDEEGFMDQLDVLKFARVGDRLRKDILYLRNLRLSSDGQIIEN